MFRIAAAVSAACVLLRVAVAADEAAAGDQCSAPGCASSEQVSMLQTAKARQEEERTLQTANVSDAAMLFRSRRSGVRDVSRRNDGQTTLTQDLNARIAPSPEWGTFRGGGSGILVRAPDFFTADPPTVVPATLWSNDIFTPSQVYPRTDPQCPMDGDDGYGYFNPKCGIPGFCNDYSDWNLAKMAAVIGSSMGDMFYEFDKFQTDTWGWGVFYATDSNAADIRCKYAEAYDGWDCPGGWLDADGTFTADSSKKGAGYFEPGNPTAGYEGGGAGCHFTNPGGSNQINQDNAYVDGDSSDPSKNLVQDKHCQCNYLFNDNWDHWVDTWMAHRIAHGVGDTWFQGGAKAPGYGLDWAACWVNNPTDMIKLQNAIWSKASDWSNQRAPLSDWKDPNVVGDVIASVNNRVYWGWNEIPVSKIIDQQEYWDAVMILLPANVCENDALGGYDYIECLQDCAQRELEDNIERWVTGDSAAKIPWLVPGAGNAASRPGSSVVIAREYYHSETGRYQRYFFCEDWTTPSGKYSIVYDQANDGCYLEKNF